MTLAKPVITTGWGGPLAYLGNDYSGLVSGRLVETTALGLDRPAQWFEPDVDHAVELLRDIVENRDRRTAARNALAERVTNECSPERIASLLAAACDLSRKGPARSLLPGPDAPSPRTR